MLHAVILRSPIARGSIRTLDKSAAQSHKGVVLVLGGDDAARDKLGGIPWEVCPPGMEHLAAFQGDPSIAEPQPVLARGRVRYVGEPVAVIVGETLQDALDGAEKVLIEFDEEEPLVGVRDALRVPGDEQGHIVFQHRTGDRAAVEREMNRAYAVVELQTHVPRLVAAPIETRGCVGFFDAGMGHWTLVASAGKPHPVRDTIAEHVLKVDPNSLRVIATDIGGGFGSKNVAYPEMAIVLWAAKLAGRPVRWICERNESFVSDTQGRDHLVTAKLAADASGRLLAIDYFSDVNLGAYLGPRGVNPCISGLRALTGPYRIGAMSAQVRGILTNTVPSGPYRGAGAPETSFVVERLVDKMAARLGLDPAEIRRRNLIGPDQLPWRAPTGFSIHSVDFPAILERALMEADWPEKETRKQTGEESRRRGIGLAFTIENYGTSYDEAAEIVVHADGRVEVLIGTKSGGQSHETSYAQIAADALDLDPTMIAIVQGDTSRIERGNGTGASRSITTGGSAILHGCIKLLNEARGMAARLLQCPTEAVQYGRGVYSVPGAAQNSGISLAAIAASAPAGRIHVSASFRPESNSFPGGCHVAEVEVDTETGCVRLLRYVAVHDAGVAVNPGVVEGQLQGGIAQGIGAALMETVRYDAESGQAVSASFVDYAMPRADDLCCFRIVLKGVPCTSNPLGAKAVGEAGAVAAPPAIVNAIVDALRGIGVEDVHLPATPPAVWNAIILARQDSIGGL